MVLLVARSTLIRNYAGGTKLHFPPPLGLLHVRKLIYAEQLRPEMELFLMENFLSFLQQPRSLGKEQLPLLLFLSRVTPTRGHISINKI